MNWSNGQKIWMTISASGYSVIHEDHEQALDNLTRRDRLVSFVISEMKEES